jgi:bacteriocin-type transport-associated protein
MRFNFFQLADDCLCQWIMASSENLSLKTSSVLIQEGEINDNIYILRRGELKIEASTETGEQVLLAELDNEGALVGEMSFLESRPPVATVTAKAGSEILVVSTTKLDKVINTDLKIGRSFYHLIAKKLSQQIKGQNSMIHSSSSNIVEPLRKVLTLFGDLEESDVGWFSTNGDLYRLKPGEQLIQEGALLADVFLVLAGEACISIQKDGENKIVGKSVRGELLGEMSMVSIDDMNASANVTTTDGMEVIAVRKNLLEEITLSNLGFGMRFYRGMARMLSQRSRDQLASKGMAFDSQQKELLSDQFDSIIDDEIDFEMMSKITTAGIRFDWLCKQFQNRIAMKSSVIT